tara:strand:- start:529 stop:642 length:114 start_codon:yes stop_codon:yes gene_type:complete
MIRFLYRMLLPPDEVIESSPNGQVIEEEEGLLAEEGS